MRERARSSSRSRLMMEVNMNLTFPIADWLFGTSDLDRGLVGTLRHALPEEDSEQQASAPRRGGGGSRRRSLTVFGHATDAV